MKIKQIITESIDPRATAKQVLAHLLQNHPDVFTQYGDEFVVSKLNQSIKNHAGDVEGAVDHLLQLLKHSDDMNEDAFDPAAAEKQMDAGAEKQAADDTDPGSRSLADKAALDAPVGGMTGQID